MSWLVAVSLAAAAALGAAPSGVRVQDDYPGALALARVRALPLVVEAWAPW